MLILAACRKDGLSHKGNTHIYGTVHYTNTHQPVPGVGVTLEYFGGNGGFGPNFNTNTVGRAVTDADGNFSFSFDAQTDGSHRDKYRLSNAGAMISGFGDEILADSINGKSTNLAFTCYALMYIMARHTHLGPPNAADFIRTSFYDVAYNYDNYDLIPGSYEVLTDTFVVVPNEPTRISYYYQRNGVISPTFYDTVTFTQPYQLYSNQY